MAKGLLLQGIGNEWNPSTRDLEKVWGRFASKSNDHLEGKAETFLVPHYQSHFIF